MKINTRILLGFLAIIVLVIALTGTNYYWNKDRLDKTNQIKDVEAPLELMVEQVIGYDAILTGAAHAALLHAQKGQLEEVKEHKVYYDEVGVKLDNLLKTDAPNLLMKSKRSQEVKDRTFEILKQLDAVNLKLVDLETRAFDAMDKGDTETAYSLIVVGDYPKYKVELLQLYKNWSAIEIETTTNVRNQIIEESNQLNILNMSSSAVIIILALIISFWIARSISKPIKKLKIDVDEITKGKLDIQLERSSLTEIKSLTDSLNRILATMKLAILRTGLSKGELGLGEAIKAKEEAEDKFKLLYETSNDAIMTIEPPTWNFTSGNPATLKMFGVKNEEELKKLAPGDLSPEKQPDGELSSVKAKKNIEKAMKDGNNFFEWVHRKYKGENFSATVLLSRVQESGKTYLQATVRDLTEHKHSEASYEYIFNESSDTIFIHDLQGKFLEVNQTACKKLGYTKQELLKMGPARIDSPKFAKFVPKRIKELKEKGHLIFESAHVTKSGREIPVEISSKIINYNGQPAILSIARDKK